MAVHDSVSKMIQGLRDRYGFRTAIPVEERRAKDPPSLRGADRFDASARDDRVRNNERQAICAHRPNNACDASCVVLLLPTERESDHPHRWIRARNGARMR